MTASANMDHTTTSRDSISSAGVVGRPVPRHRFRMRLAPAALQHWLIGLLPRSHLERNEQTNLTQGEPLAQCRLVSDPSHKDEMRKRRTVCASPRFNPCPTNGATAPSLACWISTLFQSTLPRERHGYIVVRASDTIHFASHSVRGAIHAAALGTQFQFSPREGRPSSRLPSVTSQSLQSTPHGAIAPPRTSRSQCCNFNPRPVRGRPDGCDGLVEGIAISIRALVRGGDQMNNAQADINRTFQSTPP